MKRAADVAAAYDAIAGGYDSTYLGAGDQAENTLIAEWLEELALDTQRLVPRWLDIGCGTGLLVDLVDPAANAYVGFDISPRMVEVARQRHPRFTFDVGDMDAGLPRGPFDMVVSLFASPSYSRDLQLLTDRVWRELAPGGWMFLMVEAPRHPGGRSLLDNGLADVARRWRADELAEILGGRPTERAWDNVRVQGFSSGIAQRLPGFLAERWLRLESTFVAPLWPHVGHFLILTARRRPVTLGDFEG